MVVEQDITKAMTLWASYYNTGSSHYYYFDGIMPTRYQVMAFISDKY